MQYRKFLLHQICPETPPTPLTAPIKLRHNPPLFSNANICPPFQSIEDDENVAQNSVVFYLLLEASARVLEIKKNCRWGIRST